MRREIFNYNLIELEHKVSEKKVVVVSKNFHLIYVYKYGCTRHIIIIIIIHNAHPYHGKLIFLSFNLKF